MTDKELEKQYLDMLEKLDVRGLNRRNDIIFYKCDECGTGFCAICDDCGIPINRIKCLNDKCHGYANIYDASLYKDSNEELFSGIKFELVRPHHSEMKDLDEKQVKHILEGGLIEKWISHDIIKKKMDEFSDILNKIPKQMKTLQKSALIIHHNDLDGVASAAIAEIWCKKNRYSSVEKLMYSYDQKIPDIVGDEVFYDMIFVLDLSFGSNTKEILNEWQFKIGCNVVWIDHHKTAFDKEEYFEMFSGANPFVGDKDMILGARKVGTAACVLTWNYLFDPNEIPLLIKALGQYDVWDKEGWFCWGDVMRVQYSARARYGLSPEAMIGDLLEYQDELIESMKNEGKAILRSIEEKNKNECAQYSFEAELFGHKVICMNTLEFNSTTFDSVKDGYDIMMPFAFTGKCFKCSLYTEKDIDVSHFAKLMGGGGHAKAAGFHMKIEDMITFLNTKRL